MAKYRILEGCTSASSTTLALKMNGGMSVRSCSSSSSSKSFRALCPITLMLSGSSQHGSALGKCSKPANHTQCPARLLQQEITGQDLQSLSTPKQGLAGLCHSQLLLGRPGKQRTNTFVATAPADSIMVTISPYTPWSGLKEQFHGILEKNIQVWFCWKDIAPSLF